VGACLCRQTFSTHPPQIAGCAVINANFHEGLTIFQAHMRHSAFHDGKTGTF
jgi:hypothetical protein